MDTSPPSSILAERSVLGSVLLNRDAIVAIDGWLTPEMFYLEKHAAIYDAMQGCYRRRIPPDATTVTDELKRRGKLDAVGGLLYLIELSNDVPTAVHVESYARSVKRTSILRRLMSAGASITKLGALDTDDDVEATLAKAEAELEAITQDHVERDYLPLSSLVDAYGTRLDALDNGAASVSGIATGYLDLDEVTGGLQRSDLIILAARPAVGKTSFALNIAEGAVRHASAKVGIVSLEMSQEQLNERLISMRTGIDLSRLRTGKISAEDRAHIRDALKALRDLSIYIDDAPGQTIQQVRAKARRIHAQVGLDLLIVDYLQLMRGDRRAENRVQEVSAISRGLKELARELNVPVIALSQLSRAVENRPSKVPMLSDLRESGALEQDADIVLFLYREELYDPETDKKGTAEVYIAKHRNGPTAAIALRFDANTVSFHNLERYRSAEGYEETHTGPMPYTPPEPAVVEPEAYDDPTVSADEPFFVRQDPNGLWALVERETDRVVGTFVHKGKALDKCDEAIDAYYWTQQGA